jgi:hypothetical protein
MRRPFGSGIGRPQLFRRRDPLGNDHLHVLQRFLVGFRRRPCTLAALVPRQMSDLLHLIVNLQKPPHAACRLLQPRDTKALPGHGKTDKPNLRGRPAAIVSS